MTVYKQFPRSPNRSAHTRNGDEGALNDDLFGSKNRAELSQIIVEINNLRKNRAFEAQGVFCGVALLLRLGVFRVFALNP
jgi:hypothetical protein